MSNHWEAEVKRLNSVVDTCLKYHNEDKARIAQLEADLKVAQNYEDQHYQRCQQLWAALSEIIESVQGGMYKPDVLFGSIARARLNFMWLSITAETPADAVDRISDEAMKNTKTYGW